MSEQIQSASDLLYTFVKAEKDIEAAEKMMEEAQAVKRSLLDKILSHGQLSEALEGSGVICQNSICNLIGGEICIYPEPVSVFSIKDVMEPEKSDE